MITLQNGVVATGMSKLITISILLPTTFILAQSRDLRPSEHGLPFQTHLPSSSPDMNLFFGEASVSPPLEKSPPAVVLGNSTVTAEGDDSWWRDDTQGSVKESRVRKALVIATVACGGIGVIFLLVAAFLFAVHFYRKRSSVTSTTSTAANIRNNYSVTTSATVTATAAPRK